MSWKVLPQSALLREAGIKERLRDLISGPRLATSSGDVQQALNTLEKQGWQMKNVYLDGNTPIFYFFKAIDE